MVRTQLKIIFSFSDNIEEKWYPELCHYCPDTPMILVGNQLDRREEAKNASKDKK